MLYEKKMLILSGAGKGVVLIEKSGLGVKFALRTFGLLPRDGLKAGVVTKTSVFVRDLPKTVDPSAVFYIDGVDVSEIHFAVFARDLYLYGTFGKRMWEANLMDLLRKHSGAVFAPVPQPSRLPPISAPTRVLPLPDGSGLPQSKVVLYGDETLADTDFYTPFDISGRMAAVDSFLDSPRALGSDGIASAGNPSRSAAETAGEVQSSVEHISKQASALNEVAAADAVKEAAEMVGTVQSSAEHISNQNATEHISEQASMLNKVAAADAVKEAAERAEAVQSSAENISEQASAPTEVVAAEENIISDIVEAVVQEQPTAEFEIAQDDVSAEDARTADATTYNSPIQEGASETTASRTGTTAPLAANGGAVDNDATDGARRAEQSVESTANADLNARIEVAEELEQKPMREAAAANALRAEGDGVAASATTAAQSGGERKKAGIKENVLSESAAASESSAVIDGATLPWELTAKWLKSRATRRPVVRRERVSSVKSKESVTKLREVMFFERSRADIEKLFASAPRDEELYKIMPDIEWIKVAFDGHTVSVGRSGNVFLCYAVRGEYEKNSPLGEEAQWLPKLKNAPTGKGYWLIFQDLATGEILKSE